MSAPKACLHLKVIKVPQKILLLESFAELCCFDVTNNDIAKLCMPLSKVNAPGLTGSLDFRLANRV